jgi:hypothetical protein
MADTKRRLALVLYRNMLRATSEINPKIPLRPMLPLSADPILVDTITNANDLKQCIRMAFRKETDKRDEQLKEAMRTLRQLYQLKEKLKFFRLADVDEAEKEPNVTIDIPTQDDSWTLSMIDQVSWLPVVLRQTICTIPFFHFFHFRDPCILQQAPNPFLVFRIHLKYLPRVC